VDLIAALQAMILSLCLVSCGSCGPLGASPESVGWHGLMKPVAASLPDESGMHQRRFLDLSRDRSEATGLLDAGLRASLSPVEVA
jgi:hypothetical protein